MLPRAFSAIGDYSPRQRDMAMGYRLLCHAEIEHFIEDAVKDVVLIKIKETNSTGQASLTTLTLLAYSKVNWDGLIKEEHGSESRLKSEGSNAFKHPLHALLDKAVSEYLSKIVNNNNGIKIENLKRLLKPTGIDYDGIDETWLTEMDEFGKQRGETAHTSAVGVTLLIDPKYESYRVDLLLKGLKDIDERLKKILKSSGKKQ